MRSPIPTTAHALIACTLCLATWPTPAATVYRWTDVDGHTRHGDRASADTDAEPIEVPVRVDPSAIARLYIERDGDRHLAWVDNLLAGPIEVILRAEAGAQPSAEPALPARATVPARSRTLVAYIAADTAQVGRFQLRLDAVPGDPSARPRDVEYGYPLQGGALAIGQGWGGTFSHTDDENRHAVDLATPVGTPVLAARDGVVMHVEGAFEDTGLDRDVDRGRANVVRVEHDDGTMALYAHLKPGGAMVRTGQRVRRGQLLGLSGNTGFSAGPHLHFVVQANRGMRLVSIPYRMFGPRGILRFDMPPMPATTAPPAP